MNLPTTILALLASSAALLPVAVLAQVEQSQFDGKWSVRISCPSNTEESGAKGYSYDFPASVVNGALTGSHGEAGTAGSLRIEGQISADGSFERTGEPATQTMPLKSRRLAQHTRTESKANSSAPAALEPVSKPVYATSRSQSSSRAHSNNPSPLSSNVRRSAVC